MVIKFDWFLFLETILKTIIKFLSLKTPTEVGKN